MPVVSAIVPKLYKNQCNCLLIISFKSLKLRCAEWASRTLSQGAHDSRHTGCGKSRHEWRSICDTICTQMYFRTLFFSLVGTLAGTKAMQVGHRRHWLQERRSFTLSRLSLGTTYTFGAVYFVTHHNSISGGTRHFIEGRGGGGGAETNYRCWFWNSYDSLASNHHVS